MQPKCVFGGALSDIMRSKGEATLNSTGRKIGGSKNQNNIKEP